MRSRAITKTVLLPAMAAALAACLAVGCGSDSSSGGGGNAQDLINQGWSSYSSGDFEGALVRFNEAIALDPDDELLGEAYTGLGWTNARLGLLETALGNFNYVTGTLLTATFDTFAGVSLLHLAVKNYDQAILRAEAVINASGGDYQFSHDPSVTDETLRLVRAIALFHLGPSEIEEGETAYQVAARVVQSLGGPALDPDNPRFVENLLKAIQDLREEYGDGLLSG